MTKRRFYFLLCIGLLVFTGRYDLNVSAQELGATPVLLVFAKQEQQELPDYLPPSVPERIPNDVHKQTGRLPQLNQQAFHLAVCSGWLCISLIILRLANRKRANRYRGDFQ